MVDCHIHAVLDGQHWKTAIDRHRGDPRADLCRRMLESYRGYTYLRDGGDRWGVGKLAKSLAPQYGIVYKTPLAPLSLKGHYGGFIGLQFENLKEYARLVVRQRQEGADFIKIMISGLMDFDRFGVLTEPGLKEETISALIRIAHEEGMSVMAHANGADTVRFAAKAGVDSVEHGAYLDEEALYAMKEAGTVWVPTLSTIANLRGTGRFNEQAVEQILESALLNVERFHAMGGLVAPGSDAGAWSVQHGTQKEYALLGMAGVTDTTAATQRIIEKF